MFDPANPLGLPTGHPLLDPHLSLDTLRKHSNLVNETLGLLGPFTTGRLFNQAVADGGMW
jgi:hypothetical protein